MNIEGLHVALGAVRLLRRFAIFNDIQKYRLQVLSIILLKVVGSCSVGIYLHLNLWLLTFFSLTIYLIM